MVIGAIPPNKDRFLTIDDHVNGYMDNMVDFIRKKTWYFRKLTAGHLHGRQFSVMYAALIPEKIKNLMTTGYPDKRLILTRSLTCLDEKP